MKMTRKAVEQLEEIRSGGETNMLDAANVQRIANRDGMYDLVSCMGDMSNQRERTAFLTAMMTDSFDVVETADEG